MAKNEGKLNFDLETDNKTERAEARKAAVAIDKAENETLADGRSKEPGDALSTFVNEGPEASPVDMDLDEEDFDQGPSDVSPEEGLVAGSQVPVLTPGVLAPISSLNLPNVHRDAALIVADRGQQAGRSEVAPNDGPQSVRFDPDATGDRDARDLAILLRHRPHWVNNLDRLEEFEKAEGIREPAGWVKNPVDLLEEAKRFNVFFIGDDGNFRPRPDAGL